MMYRKEYSLLLFIVLSVVLVSCGMPRPDAPTVISLRTSSDTTTQTNYVVGYTLSDIQVRWDVSYIPEAIGVDIILAKDYDCEEVYASQVVPYTNSLMQLQLLGYPTDGFNQIENLGAIFKDQIDKIPTRGQMYLCIKAVSSDSESPPSYPVIISLGY